ncbi:MAG TPA: FAD binding domain-containing protein, partial [Anaerolineales bacterium]|nr:FAD binding domain-containing protein [Anaerolineales bacterium]
MWHQYTNATSIEQVIQILGDKKERARIVAGGTDLILELERGVRKGIDALVDVTRIPKLNQISIDEDDVIHLGPLVTHNDCAGSKLIRKRAYPLARAAWDVGAPQIRNRGTIAGNLITASPANDTITPLMALNASVTLLSIRGERTIPLSEFYKGVRKSVMKADEMLVDISFPALTETQRGTFIKLALRRAQAISLVNVAIVLDLRADTVKSAVITLGAVTPI